MDVPVEIQDLISKAIRLEESGNPSDATAIYLDALKRLGNREPVFQGILYINLGTSAQHQGRMAEAAGYFRRSIDLLKNERGEAHLQCAHAHYNLAHQLLNQDDPSAPAHAAEASKRYHANPFASPIDKADASMLKVLAGIFIANEADEQSFTSTWREIRAVEACQLNQLLVENFLINWLMFNQKAYSKRYPAVQREVRDWLGNVAFKGKLSDLLST